MPDNQIYLGDGVYATRQDDAVWLDCRAQPGLSIGPSGTPAIYLEPQVLVSLLDFLGLEATAKVRRTAPEIAYRAQLSDEQGVHDDFPLRLDEQRAVDDALIAWSGRGEAHRSQTIAYTLRCCNGEEVGASRDVVNGEETPEQRDELLAAADRARRGVGRWRDQHEGADVPAWFEQFVDASWRNDAMPKFRIGDYIVWVDYADAELSEFADGRRDGTNQLYHVCELVDDPEGREVGDMKDGAVFESNDLEALQRWLFAQGAIGADKLS